MRLHFVVTRRSWDGSSWLKGDEYTRGPRILIWVHVAGPQVVEMSGALMYGVSHKDIGVLGR